MFLNEFYYWGTHFYLFVGSVGGCGRSLALSLQWIGVWGWVLVYTCCINGGKMLVAFLYWHRFVRRVFRHKVLGYYCILWLYLVLIFVRDFLEENGRKSYIAHCITYVYAYLHSVSTIWIMWNLCASRCWSFVLFLYAAKCL